MISTDKRDYCFNDEIAFKFCYADSPDLKRIEAYYWDYTREKKQLTSYRKLVIENWEQAKSKVSGADSFQVLERNIGVFGLILQMDIKPDTLEMLINTTDERYIDLVFYKANVFVELFDEYEG